VLAAAIALFAILPSGAGAMDITNFTMSPSTTQAAGHPTVAFSFERRGSETDDLSAAELELPAGMFQNPENVLKKSGSTFVGAKCTEAQFAADSCPIQSQLGTLSVDIKAASLLGLTIPGAIYMLDANQAPNNTSAATLGLKLRPDKICILFIFCAVPDKVSLKTQVVVNTFDDDDGLKTFTKNAPKTTTLGIPPIVAAGGITLDITINKMSLTFNQYYSRPAKGTFEAQSTYDANNPLRYSMVAPTACDRPAIAHLTGVSVSGQRFKVGTSKPNGATAPQAEPRYTPTGCASVPFAPTITFNPLDKRANQPSAVDFKMFVPQADATIQNAHPKIVDVDFPKGSGIDLSELVGVDGCNETQLRADQCPANSIIGNASSNAPYLPPTLTGNVYAMNPIGNTVPMAVVIRGVRGTLVIFRGTLGVRDPGNGVVGNTYARFDKIPQLPYADVTVSLTKKLYKNPNPTDPTQCTDPTKLQLITSTITGFNGKTANPGASYRLTDCNTPPTTTYIDGPVNPTSDTTPTWKFQANQPGVSFVCQVDALATVPCNASNQTVGSTTTGEYTSEPLANGTHNFKVYAINGVASGPAVAYPAFVINTDFKITPTVSATTTAAAQNTDLNTKVLIEGGQPKNIQIRLPKGFAASLAARPLCLKAAAAAGTCPSTSAIGDVTLKVGTSTTPVTGTGTAYLTEGPTAADAGGIAIKVALPGIGDYIAGAGAYLVENGRYQYIDIRTIPETVNGLSVQTQELTVQWDGDNNGLLTNPSSCVPGEFLATGTRTDNVGATPITTPYTATGCAGLAFGPTVAQTFSNLQASDDLASQYTTAIANVTATTNQSSIKKMVVSEPAALIPNYGSFGNKIDQCKAGSVFDSDPSAAEYLEFNYTVANNQGVGGNCPPQALVGVMTIKTPLLSHDLVGRIYLVDRSPLPWFGVVFDTEPGIKLTLVGVTSLAVNPQNFQQITVTFDNVPDTPVTGVKFALDGPDRTSAAGVPLSGKLLGVARFDDPACSPTAQAVATITGWAGTSVTRTQTIPFVCTGVAE
jgi:hypothetical protein